MSELQVNSEKIEAGRAKDEDGKPIKRSFISWGERIHNEITFRGVDLFLNACFGVAFTVLTHRTEAGRKFYTEPLEKFFTRAFSPFVKTASTLKTSAHWGVNILSIMFGGTTIIPLMTALEDKDRKHRMVNAIDRTIYGKDTVEHDPKFVQAYQEMDNLPKKDFWAGMGARFIALTPIIASTVHVPTHNKLTKYWYEPIGKGLKATAKFLGIKERGFLGKMSAHGNNGGPADSNLSYIMKIASFDVGLTAIYSFLHEITYKFLARKEDDHRIKKEEKKQVGLPNADQVAVDEPQQQSVLSITAAERPGTKVSAVTHAQAAVQAAPPHAIQAM